MRGHLAEGADRLEELLAADDRPTAVRADALNGEAVMASGPRRPTTARGRVREALALHRRLGNNWGAAYAVFLLGVVAAEEGDHLAAKALNEESVERFRRLGDDHYTLTAMDNLAWTLTQVGEIERARAVLEQELSLAESGGNERVEAMALGGLARIALDEGRAEDALPLPRRSLRILHGLGDAQMVSRDLRRMARGLAPIGDASTATRLPCCSEVLREEPAPTTAGRQPVEETTKIIRSHLDDDAFAEAWEGGRMMTADQAAALALEARADPELRGGRAGSDYLAGKEPFAIPGVVWASFIRISTSRRIFTIPTPLTEAFAFLRAMRGQPRHVALEPGEHQLELFEELCLGTESAGDLAVDAYLAAVAIERGSALASLDRDFARFPSLVWIRPGERTVTMPEPIGRPGISPPSSAPASASAARRPGGSRKFREAIPWTSSGRSLRGTRRTGSQRTSIGSGGAPSPAGPPGQPSPQATGEPRGPAGRPSPRGLLDIRPHEVVAALRALELSPGGRRPAGPPGGAGPPARPTGAPSALAAD